MIISDLEFSEVLVPDNSIHGGDSVSLGNIFELNNGIDMNVDADVTKELDAELDDLLDYGDRDDRLSPPWMSNDGLHDAYPSVGYLSSVEKSYVPDVCFPGESLQECLARIGAYE